MTTTATTSSTALATVEPVFAGPERLALAGFLASYTGLTREAYALDLRQFSSWCRQHGVRLFDVRRADIECFVRDLEAGGRARATVSRRLCTIAGFYRYAVEEEIARSFPGGACPPTQTRLRVARDRTGPQRGRRHVGGRLVRFGG